MTTGVLVKLSDYVFEFIANRGTDRIFLIVGGANSHLADSVSRNPRLSYVCTQHEQAAAMAAEGYARASGKVGVALVTSGPGGTNAITGVCGAWSDSVACVFISGQVPLDLTTDGRTIRQLGVQQLNIIDLVKPVTKFAVMVEKPEMIRRYLEEAFYRATHGRPGPVWIDIPTEIQRAEIEPEKLFPFMEFFTLDGELARVDSVMPKVVSSVREARRPVLIAGHGIRLAGAQAEFLTLVERLGFPVVTSWNGIDLIDHNHPLYLGCAGVMGQRGTNFAVANSDLILSIGSRMDTRQIGNSPDKYARAAKKIVVDIDHHELEKGLIKIDLPVEADAKLFITTLLNQLENFSASIGGWLENCRKWKAKYPIVLPEYKTLSRDVNSYFFVEALCQNLNDDDVVVTDMGTSFTCTMQTFRARKGQRLFTNSGFASMGFGLPGTIGAWFGSPGRRRVIGIYGDGGFQMNIQELQTVAHYQIPVKIFVLNNGSYLTIKHTQETFFDGNLAGSDPTSGYSAPDFRAVAKAYGIPSVGAYSQNNLTGAIREALDFPGPVLCEIKMPSDQRLIPISMLDRSKGHAGSPIERMYPFLEEPEFLENMIIEPA